jgi:hypothetical protein
VSAASTRPSSTVLRSEVAAGRIDYQPSSRRYMLKGGVDPSLGQQFSTSEAVNAALDQREAAVTLST